MGTVDVDKVGNADGETGSSSGAAAPLRTQRCKKSTKRTRQRRKEQPTNGTQEEDHILASSSINQTYLMVSSSAQNLDDPLLYDKTNEATRRRMEEHWRAGRDAEITQILERFHVREMVLRAEMEKLLQKREEALAQAGKMSAADMWASARVTVIDDDDDGRSGSGDTEPDEMVM